MQICHFIYEYLVSYPYWCHNIYRNRKQIHKHSSWFTWLCFYMLWTHLNSTRALDFADVTKINGRTEREWIKSNRILFDVFIINLIWEIRRIMQFGALFYKYNAIFSLLFFTALDFLSRFSWRNIENCKLQSTERATKQRYYQKCCTRKQNRKARVTNLELIPKAQMKIVIKSRIGIVSTVRWNLNRMKTAFTKHKC